MKGRLDERDMSLGSYGGWYQIFTEEIHLGLVTVEFCSIFNFYLEMIITCKNCTIIYLFLFLEAKYIDKNYST